MNEVATQFPAAEIYVLVLFFLLLAVLLYNHLGKVEFTEQDRHQLDEANLNLLPILSLIDAPDTRSLLRTRDTRLEVFRGFARALREDVLGLVRTRQLGPSTIGLAGLFFLIYGALELKALVHCGQSDLLLLGKLEVVVLRSLSR